MVNPLTVLEAGAYINRLSRRRALQGWKRYPGDARAICEAAVKDCWNGTFFQGSAGHFSQCWTRDLGMCVESLVKMGYGKECRKSLEYMLRVFAKHGRTTTTIFPGPRARRGRGGAAEQTRDKPVNIYTEGADTLPYLVRSLRVLDARDFVEQHRKFLESEVRRYYKTVFDARRGIVRMDRHFSGAKDCVNRASACYDNCMVAILSKELDSLGFENPFQKVDFEETLRKRFWKRDHFAEDLSGAKEIAADANITPYLYNLVEDEEMLKASIETLRSKKMDQPFPIRHTERRVPGREKLIPHIFTPNYQGDTVWTQFGPMFIEIVSRVDRGLAKTYIGKYKEWIEKHQNYLELFNADGSVYRGRGYHADEGMIWAAMAWEWF